MVGSVPVFGHGFMTSGRESIMRKSIDYVITWAVAAVLVVGAFVVASANTESKSPLTQLRRRVTTLEIRADRQRRAIVDLRVDNEVQAAKIGDLTDRVIVLENFRSNTNAWITVIDKRTADLDAQGDYSGPVRANQVSSSTCSAVDAVWNATGGLDCPPAP